ncbi:MAG: CheR family methyltransferase [Pseudomonadota bacterium]
MGEPPLEDLEIDLLLEAVFQRLGFDFRDYDRGTLKHKILALMQSESVATVSALQDRVLHDPRTSLALLQTIAHPAAALFADPLHLRLLRERVVGHLRSYPEPSIWIAECSSAQTAWTMAILLEEEQLYHKTLIYATGASADVPRMGWQTTVSAAYVGKCEANYRDSGGKARLADYFDAQADQMVLRPRLQRNIVWAQHSLVTDASFNEFQLILCRGARLDFGPLLRSRALHLFHDSLSRFGMLSIDVCPAAEVLRLPTAYQPVCVEQGLFKRID